MADPLPLSLAMRSDGKRTRPRFFTDEQIARALKIQYPKLRQCIGPQIKSSNRSLLCKPWARLRMAPYAYLRTKAGPHEKRLESWR